MSVRLVVFVIVHDQRKPPTGAFTTTNPDHLFEIHSIVDFGGNDLHSTWHNIDGFAPKDAADALLHYESKKFTIKPLGQFVEMQFPGVGYNYVKFQATLLEKPFKQPDGFTVYASLNDLNGEMVIRKRRLVFVAGTPPADKVAAMDAKQCMVVLGIPRISLALVSWRSEFHTKHPTDTRDPLNWTMPYELVIVGAYDEQCSGQDE